MELTERVKRIKFANAIMIDCIRFERGEISLKQLFHIFINEVLIFLEVEE